MELKTLKDLRISITAIERLERYGDPEVEFERLPIAGIKDKGYVGKPHTYTQEEIDKGHWYHNDARMVEFECETKFVSFNELQQIAKEWIEELRKIISSKEHNGYGDDEAIDCSAKIDWIKHFFNLEDLK